MWRWHLKNNPLLATLKLQEYKETYPNNWQARNILLVQHTHTVNPQENPGDSQTAITKLRMLYIQAIVYLSIHLNCLQPAILPNQIHAYKQKDTMLLQFSLITALIFNMLSCEV